MEPTVNALYWTVLFPSFFMESSGDSSSLWLIFTGAIVGTCLGPFLGEILTLIFPFEGPGPMTRFRRLMAKLITRLKRLMTKLRRSKVGDAGLGGPDNPDSPDSEIGIRPYRKPAPEPPPSPATDICRAIVWGLSKADLSKADLSEADLSKADISEATLWGRRLDLTGGSTPDIKTRRSVDLKSPSENP